MRVMKLYFQIKLWCLKGVLWWAWDLEPYSSAINVCVLSVYAWLKSNVYNYQVMFFFQVMIFHTVKFELSSLSLEYCLLEYFVLFSTYLHIGYKKLK